MMVKRLVAFLFLLWFSGVLPLVAADAFDTIAARITEDALGSQGRSRGRQGDNRAKQLMGQMKADGSFDLDYKTTVRSSWAPNRHLDNLLTMARAYRQQGNQLYQNAQLRGKIEKGLEFWYSSNPKSNNWWHNQIAVPQRLGKILLIMQSGSKGLPDELVAKLVERMKAQGGNPKAQAGANKVDVALHYLYRACLTKDRAVMKMALDEMFDPLRFTTKEGVQYDFSYMQHGPQLYIGGYGLVLVDVVSEVALFVKDTEFALKPEQMEVLSGFVRKAYLPAIRGSHFNYNVLGRGVTRKGALSQRGFTGILERLVRLDPDNAKEYGLAIERLSGRKKADYGLESFNRHFFRADYMLHQRPGYTVDVRTVSKRTGRNEQGVGNGEGYKSYFLSDGGMSIVRTGEEYFDIFPVWDWAKVPGVMCPAANPIPLGRDWDHRGETEMTGGVSDGLYGMFVYDYRDTYKGLNSWGKRAWFFFDDEIVCMGSGIRSESAFPMQTTINQCLLKGKVGVEAGGRAKESKLGTTEKGDIRWAHHDGVGYWIAQGQQAGLSVRKQEGAWYDINTGYSKETVKEDVFCLWLEHGAKPKAGSYCYVVLPDCSLQKIRNNPMKDVQFLANTPQMQAVYHRKLDVLQVVFWERGELKQGRVAVTADAPCAVMIRDVSRPKARVFVSDPAQTLDKVTLKLVLPAFAQGKTCRFNLAKSPEAAGKSVQMDVASSS
ncbi:MAG: polysaccharide lyase 8 family protein [Puniceicoccales bacterium]|nr:polysaccharide lyase 8 family protein [Puniceicoccales bacterium]